MSLTAETHTLLSEELIASVQSALQILFSSTQTVTDKISAQRAAADAYLRSFQLKPEAYLVSIEFLTRYIPNCNTSSDLNAVIFFAAQTIANKIRRQQSFPEELKWSYHEWFHRILYWISCGMQGDIKTPKFIN